VAALVIAATSGDPAASHGALHLTAEHFSIVVTDALALLLAIAMGIQNAAARKLAVPDLTTTVLTMTLTGIGADSRSGQRGHLMLARRLLAVIVMLGGGILGAWLVLRVSATAALAVTAGLLLVAAACAALATRTQAPWRSAGTASHSTAPR
jgi:uncharacterized membrane protein YoaK (UPF0700 family)